MEQCRSSGEIPWGFFFKQIYFFTQNPFLCLGLFCTIISLSEELWGYFCADKDRNLHSEVAAASRASSADVLYRYLFCYFCYRVHNSIKWSLEKMILWSNTFTQLKEWSHSRGPEQPQGTVQASSICVSLVGSVQNWFLSFWRVNKYIRHEGKISAHNKAAVPSRDGF